MRASRTGRKSRTNLDEPIVAAPSCCGQFTTPVVSGQHWLDYTMASSDTRRKSGCRHRRTPNFMMGSAPQAAMHECRDRTRAVRGVGTAAGHCVRADHARDRSLHSEFGVDVRETGHIWRTSISSICVPSCEEKWNVTHLRPDDFGRRSAYPGLFRVARIAKKAGLPLT